MGAEVALGQMEEPAGASHQALTSIVSARVSCCDIKLSA